MSRLDQKLELAFAPLATAVQTGRIPGGVLGIVDNAGNRVMRSLGAAQLVPQHREMTDNTWFDLASLTKVIFTTQRILALADAGRIDLDAPLISALPDFRQYNPDNWERRVTFRQCLGHQTPFPAVFPLYTYGRDPQLLRAFLLQHQWEAGPAVYSDINFMLLGLALERIERQGIRQMDPGPGFAWSADPAQSAATEDDSWRHRVLVGEVHDDNCSALEGAGHAGLFGTADAVLDFARDRLADTGPDAPIRTPLSARRTHGWERPYEGWSGGELCSPASIGHTGFTGTGLWIDFERGCAWTLLTNRVHPTRHFDSGIVALRRAVGDLINSD
ncbi:serine hydrolase domain-containing protein [Devosia sp. RR2S18]|uniref:serine hydrolase domain-containing protein n=1 Tax=Devosia rhizosphaerae TaxID=3049774 RepID=UPI00253FB8E4|nr:serine hydrolase domain-containing protein [Devosia sp. RR2S18]WIJ23950.1 serine hydrolase domain-containing protein [Devosia sp. RR2S18]